jgi:hypothetical protein
MLRFLGSNWATELIENLQPVLIGIFAVVGSVATGYAIFLGASLAKAEDESKRQQAKSRIVKTLIGLFIVLVLSLFLIGNPPLLVNMGLLDGVTTRNICATCNVDRVECGCQEIIRKHLMIDGLSVTIVDK